MLRECRDPRGVGGDPGADGRDDGELHEGRPKR
jgi:hypothetical protein